MSKIGAIMLVVIGVIMAYLGLLVAVPILVDFAATANTTMAASSNMSNYPGTVGALISAPWWLFFVPASIGIVLVIQILRKP